MAEQSAAFSMCGDITTLINIPVEHSVSGTGSSAAGARFGRLQQQSVKRRVGVLHADEECPPLH